MVSLRDWAAGSDLRSALSSGAVYAGLGVIWALVSGAGVGGVTSAVLAGVVFGVVMGLFARKKTGDLSGLTPQQRASVQRAVRRGEAPAEASLAKATVRRAQLVQEQSAQRWPYMVLGGFALLSILLATTEALAGSLRINDILLVVFWMAFLPLLRWVEGRATERARRAEAAAREISGKQLSGPS